jgi:ribose 1,5-bisphosphokinase PhnN
MTQTPQKARLFRRKITRQEEERQEIMLCLARTRTLIHQAYGCFNTTNDGELIESYVFEINALQARYNYLLRRLKELEGVT